VEPTAGERAARASLPHVRALAVLLALLVLLAGAAVAVTVWVLPWYVRQQCIEAAAAHGIHLAVDEARIDPDGFHLVGVRATSAMVRGARARAPTVDVQTSALRPKTVTVRAAELTLGGSWSDIDSDLARWRASPNGGGAGAWAPVSVIVDGARVVWQAPAGESLRVEAADVHATVAWNDRGTELHARSDQVTAAVSRGTVGPWRLDIDRTPVASRVRVAFDPGVPEACTLLIVGDGDRTRSVDMLIPRSPLAHLGVAQTFLGLNGQSLQIEATVRYTALGPTRADANAKGGLFGIEVPGLPNPIDVSWEGTVSGDASAGIDVSPPPSGGALQSPPRSGGALQKNARLAVGPLVGPVTGTLKRFDDGFRINLAWAAGPVPCAWFAVERGPGQPFDVGYELRKLGAAKVKGDVSASMMVSFDSRDLGATKVDVATELGCRGSFF
jgi:hypothetical protein